MSPIREVAEVNPVTRPKASTLTTVCVNEEPYVPAVTPEFAKPITGLEAVPVNVIGAAEETILTGS